jgi:hypothetical protein
VEPKISTIGQAAYNTEIENTSRIRGRGRNIAIAKLAGLATRISAKKLDSPDPFSP